MKKKGLLVLAMTVSLALFAGCSININLSDGQNANSQGTTSNSTTDNQTTENTKSSVNLDEINKTISSYEKEVNKVGDLVDNAKAGSSRQKNIDEYSKISSEIKEIENKIDIYDDDLENMYHNGSLSQSDYRDFEKKLDSLDNKLDNYEDKIELIFGVDD